MEHFRLPNLSVEAVKLRLILALKTVSSSSTCTYSEYDDYYLFDGSTSSLSNLVIPGDKIITAIVTNAIGKSKMLGKVSVSSITGPDEIVLGWQFQARMKK